MNNSQNNELSNYYWKCTVCGYEYDSEELPKDFICPVCGATSEKFEPGSRIEDEE